MSKITGIGGMFIRYNHDAKKLLTWYRDVLGLDVSEHGINFLTPNHFTLISFDNESETKLNFTVDDLEHFMDQLQEKGVKVVHEIMRTNFGKIAQIEDPAGNTVELWKPFDTEYTCMVRQEIAEFNSSEKQAHLQCHKRAHSVVDDAS